MPRFPSPWKLGALKTPTQPVIIRRSPFPVPSHSRPTPTPRAAIAQNSQFHRPTSRTVEAYPLFSPAQHHRGDLLPPPDSASVFVAATAPASRCPPTTARASLNPEPSCIGSSRANHRSIEYGPPVSSDPRILHMSARWCVALRRRMLVSIAPTRATSRPLCLRLPSRTEPRR